MSRPSISPVQALDHLRISVADLDAQTVNYQALFGVPPRWKGIIAGAESAVFQAGNVAVWLLASTSPRGLEGVCFRVDDIERMRRRLKSVGVAFGKSVAHDPLWASEEHGDPLRMDAVECSSTRGLSLAFVDRPQPYAATDSREIEGLDHVVIASGDAQATAFLLAAQLGMDMRMDIRRPEWDARLLFFRCGDLIVEVFEQLGQTGDAKEQPTDDSFYGLTWRVPDADAAHQRLEASGFDVSAVRSGRRPGSRVLTVRDRTAQVATLLIESPAP